MARLLSRCSVFRFFALATDTITRKPQHDKATSRRQANTGLEPRRQDRHCLVDLTVRRPPEF
jgi:hypothetical protein